MATEKKNIFITELPEKFTYTTPFSGGGPTANIPKRDHIEHYEFLKWEFERVLTSKKLSQKQAAAIQAEGTYLEFQGKEGYDLIFKSLEDVRSNVRLLNVKVVDSVVTATVYIPEGKESFFVRRLEDYKSKTTQTGKPRNGQLFDSIEHVRLALLKSSFWIGKEEDIPKNLPAWCEVWLRTKPNTDNGETLQSFNVICAGLNIAVNKQKLVFPERIVKLVKADASQLGKLIEYCDNLAELRRAPETACFFEAETTQDQKYWCDNLRERVTYESNGVAVCLLDTGVNQGHPLLEPIISEEDVQTVDPVWGAYDHNGHGTEMAGMVCYGDLMDKLLTTETYNIPFILESVKILSPKGENEPQLYGAITQQGVSLAEINNPDVNRIICMAVTSDKYTTDDGSPTSWSAGIDNITSGANEAKKKKRLFFISAGNVYPNELQELSYPQVNQLHGVESPGQSWNAVSVGAYTSKTTIKEKLLRNYAPVTSTGNLSPYSSTSATWSRKWPIKPEILCEGGNIATDGTSYTESDDLSLLTTYFKPSERLFTSSSATSAATAQAAHIAAMLAAEYPDIWPETVRALLIHSARWTPEMKQMFCKDDSKKEGRSLLLHTCGYGVPNLKRAMRCVDNQVNLIIQSELKPFKKTSTGVKMNQMCLHSLPWPKETLLQLGDIEAELRITLSYFIEPGPGEIGWKDKYRYPSCGLRFELINKNENRKDFLNRINKEMRGEEYDSSESSSGSEDWYLGSNNRNVGSIHSDFKILRAADLADACLIAVYPVTGWWRSRQYLRKYNESIRYSLIVTISTPEENVDFYTPIIAAIKTKVPVEVVTPFSKKNKG
jgi:hypothetical protein